MQGMVVNGVVLSLKLAPEKGAAYVCSLDVSNRDVNVVCAAVAVQVFLCHQRRGCWGFSASGECLFRGGCVCAAVRLLQERVVLLVSLLLWWWLRVRGGVVAGLSAGGPWPM